MPKPTVKPVSSSPGLTFEEFRELVGKLRNVSDILARELSNHSGSKRAEMLSRMSRSICCNCRILGSRRLSLSLQSFMRSYIGLIQEESC